MEYWRKIRCQAGVMVLSILAGCIAADEQLKYVGDADLEHYRDTAVQIDYPHVCTPTCEESAISYTEPRTVSGRRRDEIWDVTLAECLHLALSNNRVIRTASSLEPFAGFVPRNLNQFASVYDPAIQESGVLFGGRGIEAALSDFDAQFSTSMLWGRNELLQNNPFVGGVLGGTLVQDSGVFNSELSKTFGYGGSFTVSHDWIYSSSNAGAQLFPSNYTGNLTTSYRQPLWAGAGAEFSRIAGPLNPNFGAITGVSQGVVIARINNDITVADFQANVRNLLKDVEDRYWDLYLQYRLYDTAVSARNSALRTWREAKAKVDVGGTAGFDIADEPQALDQYYEARAATERSLNSIYVYEVGLRQLIGLPVNDGRIIRPADEPVESKLVPVWNASLAEALTRRVELRRQKWSIKSLELQLKAARSLTNPQLDFVSSYQVNAFGDRLFGENDADGVTAQGLRSAYETLTQGSQTGWNLGFVFSVPVGFRSAHAQVRNYELRLAKAREVLAVEELDVSHELAVAFQNLAANFVAAQSNLNRRLAAEKRVDIFEKKREFGEVTADPVLRAQRSLADAEREYFTSLVQYNKSIVELHYRKGTLLEANNVYLAEENWTPAAYHDALRRAWARSHAIDHPRLETEPLEFVSPFGASCGPGDVLSPAELPTQEPWQQAPSPELLPQAPTPEELPQAPTPKPLPQAPAAPESGEAVPQASGFSPIFPPKPPTILPGSFAPPASAPVTSRGKSSSRGHVVIAPATFNSNVEPAAPAE